MTARCLFDPEPLAERIWREVGYRPKSPRDLVPPLMETFDIAVVIVPRLSIGSVNAWLSKRGRPSNIRHRDRELRGCLLARRSHGLVFIDGSMSEDERQFAMSHEFAHFFAHYLEPRRKALARFGDAILPVLDGERSATTAERLSSILQGVPLGTFEDFLGRDGEGFERRTSRPSRPKPICSHSNSWRREAKSRSYCDPASCERQYCAKNSDCRSGRQKSGTSF